MGDLKPSKVDIDKQNKKYVLHLNMITYQFAPLLCFQLKPSKS